MQLNKIIIVDSGGVYITQYPPSDSNKPQLYSGFLVALDATLKYFGESFRQVSEIRGQNYVGLLKRLGDSLRIFGLFTIDEESQVDRYIKPVFNFIAEQICALAAYEEFLEAGFVTGETISMFSNLLNRICVQIQDLLRMLSDIDAIFESLYKSHGDHIIDIIRSQLGELSRFMRIDKEGLHIHTVEDIKIILDLVSDTMESLNDLIKAEKIEVSPRTKHEEDIGDAIVSIVDILDKKFIRVISGFLSGSDIIVLGSETLLNLFLKIASLFEISPYVHTDDIQLIYLPNTSVLILLRFYQEIPKGKSTAIIVDSINRKVNGGVDIFLAKKIYKEITNKIRKKTHPIDVYRAIKEIIDDLRESIYAVIDFIRSGKEKDSADYYSLIRRLGKYRDLATLKAIFSIAIKLYPTEKIRLYELYGACRNDIFPYIKVLEA